MTTEALILIPAFNEEGAVGGVVQEVRAVDARRAGAGGGRLLRRTPPCPVAREAGARVLPLPHHLGLGGCVQAGYRLAFELGYEYVIRVDGDGQHDPRDIPEILAALEREGCEMVIGSRFINGAGPSFGALARGGYRFLSRRAAADSGQDRCAIRLPDSWA